MTAALTGSGQALPAPMSQTELWDGYFRDHYGAADISRKIWAASAIDVRRGVVNPAEEGIVVGDPGLDILLARGLGMADTVQRLHIGHMGCYAALPGSRRHRRLRDSTVTPSGAAVS